AEDTRYSTLQDKHHGERSYQPSDQQRCHGTSRHDPVFPCSHKLLFRHTQGRQRHRRSLDREQQSLRVYDL
ncbi:hypothetical protein A1F97_11279, partial [Pyrenophora tritici-repentis]